MSRGQVDEAAQVAAIRAIADAAKRGLKVTGMTARPGGGYRFDHEPLGRRRRTPEAASPPPPKSLRGFAREAAQGSLL